MASGEWRVKDREDVMSVQHYRELKVWQAAMDMAEQCYRATKTFPKEELFGMTCQIRRAAASIPANIAEGQGRQHTKEFLHHLSIARGSLMELETHLLLCRRMGMLTAETLEPLLQLADQISRMLSGLRHGARSQAVISLPSPLATRHSPLAPSICPLPIFELPFLADGPQKPPRIRPSVTPRGAGAAVAPQALSETTSCRRHTQTRPSGIGAQSAAPPDDAGLAFHGLAPRPSLDSWGESRRDAGPVRLFHESQNTNARLAGLTEGLVPFPEVGQEFLGFRLVGELGRGAFGRVYLAHQGDLADRPVALKVSTGCFAESQKLARLQHTHIVPIYSFHRAGPLQAVVMPYYGPTTLADVLETLGRHDTLPASGKGLVSTLHSRRTRSGVIAAVRPPSAPVAPSASIEGRPESPTADSPATLTTLRMLEGLSYVEAALWIGARLAEGLAHAHERGVLHRDLKPANVLLTDEGQPMLLDFNLAEDVKALGEAAGRVGGTLPYMAPEHLTAYQGQPADVDARSDIYALGVILYELLTGRHPFGKQPLALDRMIRDRTRLPPPARTLNRGVTPAVDSILRRCLAPNPARRYQTAAELQEDLDRQRQHRPLRHAPNPSVRERVVKWFRRNPRAVTATRMGLAAGVLLALLTAGLLWRGEQVARYESADRLKGFRDDLAAARLLLGARAADVDERVEGRQAAQRALDRYPVDADGRWRDQPSFQRLSEEEKGRVQTELGEALVLLASADAGEPGRVSARKDVEEALRLNRLAETCYPDGHGAAGAVGAAGRSGGAAGTRRGSAAAARPGRRGAGARRRGRVFAGAGAGGPGPAGGCGRGAAGRRRPRAGQLRRAIPDGQLLPGRLHRRAGPGRRRRRLLQRLHRHAAGLPRRLRQPRPDAAAPRPVRGGRGRLHAGRPAAPRPDRLPHQPGAGAARGCITIRRSWTI